MGGTVGLELTVAPDGSVSDVKVIRPAGFGLDEAAVAAARRFKFKPATHDGKPIASTVSFDQRFAVRPHLSSELLAEPPAEIKPVEPRYQSTVLAGGPTSAASSTTVRNRDFELRLLRTPNDILSLVPGLLAVQHQGGGKADQLFLRGFDADHGTDVAVFLDGVPINLPSHAHGQGYTDLHFVIPELIDRIEVVKGPYEAKNGDFATGGALHLYTRERPESQVGLSVGGFMTRGCEGSADLCKVIAQERLVGIVSPKLSGWAQKLRPLVAAELARDQGPFDHPQQLYRYNVMGRLAFDATPSTSLGAFLSAYGASWNSSGQIPLREVEAGKLSRWGSIDPTEGGVSERQQATIWLRHRDATKDFEANVWFLRYRLAMWNDFTFFLRNRIDGDLIEQSDARLSSGASLAYHAHARWRGISFRTTVGAQLRWDGAHVELWDSTSTNGRFRERLLRRSDAEVDVTNLAAYLQEDVGWTRWLRTIVGLRADWLGFTVDDRLDRRGAGARERSVISPKATVVLQPHRVLDLYLNFGMGFHSNDARISVLQGLRTAGGSLVNVVPRIYAGEFGARFTWKQHVTLAAALWASYLQNETVFVGDEGGFQPSDPTRRIGVDVELRAQPAAWLLLDADFVWASAVIMPATGREGRLALVPIVQLTAGATVRWRGLRAGLRMRYLGERPAFDTNREEYRAFFASQPQRVTATSWVVFDLYGAYRWRWLEAGLAVVNLFDSSWREAQLGHRSCTQRDYSDPTAVGYQACAVEGAGMPDVHFTPGPPFDLQLTLRAYW